MSLPSPIPGHAWTPQHLPTCFVVFFLLRLGVRAASNSAYSGYPELWISRYPAHRYRTVPSPGFEPTTLWLRVWRPNYSATMLHYLHVPANPPILNRVVSNQISPGATCNQTIKNSPETKSRRRIPCQRCVKCSKYTTLGVTSWIKLTEASLLNFGLLISNSSFMSCTVQLLSPLIQWLRFFSTWSLSVSGDVSITCFHHLQAAQTSNSSSS
jgi:hypothetical protein